MNDTKMVDMMVGALSDPFDDCHMGVTAENVAKTYKVSRQDQDALAVESHRRAGCAIDQGFFKAQIVPIEIRAKRERVPIPDRRNRAAGQYGREARQAAHYI